MDTFTLNTLNKYINNYKHDIILKLATEKFSEKSLSTQANLVNMVLDYSPKTKSSFQFPEKIDLSKLRIKPQSFIPKNKINTEIKKEDNTNLKNYDEYNRKEDNRNASSQKNSESESDNNINANANTNVNNMNNTSHTPTENSNSNLSLKTNSFDNLRLIQKHQIRIYPLSKSNYFELSFTPNETVHSLKKKIYSKIGGIVNMELKYNSLDAYELRPTKGMNVIYFKPKNKPEKEKEISSDDLSEKYAPDMSKPSFENKALIKDLDNDSLCFIERADYKPKNNASNIDTDSLIDDNKKAYGEYITSTGESKINCKVFIKIGDYVQTKIVNLDSNSCLRDVFEKISNSDNIKEKNSEYYYFVEHSEDNENENMEEAINPDLEVKFLFPYVLDLYKKKFADVPNVSRKNNFGLYFEEKKNEIVEKKQEYVLNDTTAGVYQEFSVIKINSHNKRQERILGIDLYNLKNEIPKNSAGIFSRKKAKIQERKIKDIQEIKDTGEKTFEIIVSSGDQIDKRLKYEAPNANVKNEIIAKLNYIMKMNNI